MSIHVAITRRVRPGCEAEFQQGLREFMQASFQHGGVLGAQMLTPPPGSNSREYGILRTFADERERDEFYSSPIFKAWDARARTLTEGKPEYRQLHGLEAWFRSPGDPPPRWKMALVTLLGVYPVSLLIGIILAPQLRTLPLALNLFVVSALIVTCLTWLVMPPLTRWFKPWLHPQGQKKESPT
jgi:antibiotic biosynthesis monooxygenase (ABM) superfamily enzyme